MRYPRLLLVVGLNLIFAVSLPGGVQTVPPPPPPVPAAKSKAPQYDPQRVQEQEQQDDPFKAERLKALNKSRHAALKKDTDKLLELATELKMYVDKSNENTLSLDVVRKAEAIEKLAHSVREKMKGM